MTPNDDVRDAQREAQGEPVLYVVVKDDGSTKPWTRLTRDTMQDAEKLRVEYEAAWGEKFRILPLYLSPRDALDSPPATSFCKVCGRRAQDCTTGCGGTPNYCADCGKWIGSATNLTHTCSPQSPSRDALDRGQDDTERMDLIDEYLDGIDFDHTPEGKPVPILDWFIGDGSGHFKTRGDDWRDAVDHAREVLDAARSRSTAGSSQPQDGGRGA